MAKLIQPPWERGNFTAVPNSIIRNPKVSRGALALLIEIKSHRDGWELSERQLVRDGEEGRYWIRQRLAELEEAGYLLRLRERKDGGTFGVSIWVASWTPMGEVEAVRIETNLRENGVVTFRPVETERDPRPVNPEPRSENRTLVEKRSDPPRSGNQTTKNKKKHQEEETTTTTREALEQIRNTFGKDPGGGIRDLFQAFGFDPISVPAAEKLAVSLVCAAALKEEPLQRKTSFALEYLEERLADLSSSEYGHRAAIRFILQDAPRWFAKRLERETDPKAVAKASLPSHFHPRADLDDRSPVFVCQCEDETGRRDPHTGKLLDVCTACGGRV